MGYLVNHPGGLAGAHGIGYDYVLGDLAASTSSPESAYLTARVPVAHCTVRGLAPVTEKVQLTHGPIPSQTSSSWACAGSRTTLTPSGCLRRALGRATPTGWWSHRRPGRQRDSPISATCTGVVAEFHSHGGSRSFFSATDDRDEQGFRIYGVVGRLDAPRYRS